MEVGDLIPIIVFVYIAYFSCVCCCIVLGPRKIVRKVCTTVLTADTSWPEESAFLHCVASTTMGPITCNVMIDVADAVRV